MATAPLGVQSVPGLNPVTAQIPDYAIKQMQAARNAQIANMLLQQGQAPLEYDHGGRVGWGAGLAKALQSGLGMYLGNQTMQQQADLQQQGMQAMGQAYGMGQQPDPQALAAALSPASQALGQGASQGSVGPTVANASRMDTLAAQPPQASPPAPGMGGVQTPLNPYGAPPILAYMASQGDPGAMEQMKTFLANQALTPEIKNNNWSGITPAQARAMTLAKATKEAQIEYKPGEFTTNPFTGQSGFYPSLPANSQPIGPVGPDGHVAGVAAVPGAIPVASRTAGAVAGSEAAGRFPYQTQTILDASGNPTVATNGQVFPGVGGGGSVSSAPLGGAAGPGVSGPQQSQYQPPPITRRTGLSATTTNLLGQGGDLLKSAQAAQSNNQNVYSYLDEIGTLVNSGAKFGPGTADMARWKAIANNFVPGIDLTGAQTNQDVMHKLSASLAGSNPARSDADLAQWQARNPSGELTNQAIKELLPILQRQAQVQDARSNVLTRNANGGLEKLPDLYNQFNQIASPSLVSDGQALARASQQGTQAVQQFMQQYKAHYPDWQARLGKIQKLDGMGAF